MGGYKATTLAIGVAFWGNPSAIGRVEDPQPPDRSCNLVGNIKSGCLVADNENALANDELFFQELKMFLK